MKPTAHSHDAQRDVSLLAIDQYMREVRWIELPTPEEEAQLIARVERGRVERAQPQPDHWRLMLAKHARDRLVEAYQPLVIHIAKAVVTCFTSMDMLDLIQEGTIGLMQAIDHNDSSKGLPLRQLACYCIRQAIFRALYRRDRVLRLPERVELRLHKLHKVEKQLAEQFNREPTHAEIAEALQVSEQQVADLCLWRYRGNMSSLHALLEEAQVEDRLDFVSLFEQAVIADEHHQQELEIMLAQAMASALPEQEQHVVRLRFGLDEQVNTPKTQREVAEGLGCSTTSVQRIERRALLSLHQVLVSTYDQCQEECVA